MEVVVVDVVLRDLLIVDVVVLDFLIVDVVVRVILLRKVDLKRKIFTPFWSWTWWCSTFWSWTWCYPVGVVVVDVM